MLPYCLKSQVLKNEMTVSFVIPAFNAHDYIKRCLDSIFVLKSELPDFEVIVIDDASTDDTVEIVRKYASKNDGVKLLCQKENRRQGAARNRGLAVAQGDFIVFVDSDDETAHGVLSAIKMARENDCDMVAMRTEKVSDNGVKKENYLPYNSWTIFTGIELQTEHPFWGTAPWAYIYRKSFLQKVNYPFAEEVLYEDSDFVNVHLYHAQRMAYCYECGYWYIENTSSTTNTISYKSVCDYALLGTRMLSFYESISDKTSKYANSILEGGSYNVMIACRKLIKLKSKSDVKAFYNRFDSYYDRKLLLKYKTPKCYWTWWTRFCLKHKYLTILLVEIGRPFVLIRIKKQNNQLETT